MELPKAFADRMAVLLGSDFDAFLASYDKPPVRALRVNPLKMSAEDFERVADFPIERIPHIDGAYTFECEHIGSHPLHHSGAIYVQEPSAMAVVASVDIERDWDVLDVCAAPGGKSTQAGVQNTEGIVVSNEIISSRAKILLQNIERLGLKNSVVMNTDSETLGKTFEKRFDLVIVDAPCSGEGMMRKNELAISEWSEENVLACAERQTEILENVFDTVKGGGRLIYSTCTFSVEENEGVVDKFLSRHPDFHLIPVKAEISEISADGISFDGCTVADIALCRRFYPHISGGEGQFLALFERDGQSAPAPKRQERKPDGRREADGRRNTQATKAEAQKNAKKPNAQAMRDTDCVRAFLRECLGRDDFPIELRPDGAYIPAIPSLGESGVFSSGVKVGTVQKGRVIPHHRFFMAYGGDFINKIELTHIDGATEKYLSGETFTVGGVHGYAAVTYHGAVLGGVKVSDNTAKNYYPKGLRK